MRKVLYSGDVKTFVDSYDKKSYFIWNEKVGEIVAVRKFIRDHYLLEQSFRCAYCRIEKKEAHGATWDIEHILPKQKYPQFLLEPENLAIACKECNGPKDDTNLLVSKRTNMTALPNSSEDYLIVHPHFDIFSDHFELTVLGGRRSYRVLDNKKAKRTYLACDFFRFDYKFCEWDCFDHEIVKEFSDFLDHCPPDSDPKEIKRMLGHISFVLNVDF